MAGAFRMIIRLGLAFGICGFEIAFAFAAAGQAHALPAELQSIARESLVSGFAVAYWTGGTTCLAALGLSVCARTRGAATREL